MSPNSEPPPPAETARNGYLFWGPIAFAIFVTEILGIGWVQKQVKKIFDIVVDWPTISTTVGHLQQRWSLVAVAVVSVIAAIAFHALAYPQTQQTPQGRAMPPRGLKGSVPFYTWQLGLLLTGLAVIPGLVLASVTDWDNLKLGYAIWGAFALVGVIFPSALLFLARREVQFPTAFYTFRSLRDMRPWLATLLGASLGAGLATLVLHLALYPWPSITQEKARYAGLKAGEARDKARREIDDLGASSILKYSTQTRGIANGRDAWLVFFSPADDSRLEYSGCIVTVTERGANATSECSTSPS